MSNTTNTQRVTKEYALFIETIMIKPILPTNSRAPTKHKALRALFEQEEIQLKAVSNNILATQVDCAISDLGATCHFLVKGTPIVNKELAVNPIKITLPNGLIIQSTHTCNIDIPWLPHHVTSVHIVPGLAHASRRL